MVVLVCWVGIACCCLGLLLVLVCVAWVVFPYWCNLDVGCLVMIVVCSLLCWVWLMCFGGCRAVLVVVIMVRALGFVV